MMQKRSVGRTLFEEQCARVSSRDQGRGALHSMAGGPRDRLYRRSKDPVPLSSPYRTPFSPIDGSPLMHDGERASAGREPHSGLATAVMVASIRSLSLKHKPTHVSLRTEARKAGMTR